MNGFYPALDGIIKSNLTASSINPELAANIAKSIVSDVVERFGGQMVYMKYNSRDQLDEKHRRIVAEFDGTNRIAICQKYRITTVWLKKLLARAKHEHAR